MPGPCEDAAKLLEVGATLAELTMLDNALVYLECGRPPQPGAVTFAIHGLARGGACARACVQQTDSSWVERGRC